VKLKTIRLTLDVPILMHRCLKKRAALLGLSIEQTILAILRKLMAPQTQPTKRRAQFPLIVTKGPKVNLANELIYRLIEFP